MDSKRITAVLAWAKRFSVTAHRTTTPRVVRRQFDFLTLDDYYRQIPAKLEGLSGVTWVDLDEANGRLVVGVIARSDVGVVQAALAPVRIPAGMLSIEVAGPIVNEQTLRSLLRPVNGGAQICNPAFGGPGLCECTMGLTVYKKDGNGYPDPQLGRFFLTASHCTTSQTQLLGDTVAQPSAGNPIGVEVAEAPIGSFSGCSAYGFATCRYADVAAFQFLNVSDGTFGYVYRTPGVNNLNISGSESVLGNVFGAIVGETVRKVGRTTGESSGIVNATCSHTTINNITTICAHRANYVSDPGDSGAPVFIPFTSGNSSTPRYVGIHYARQGTQRWYSPWNMISAALNYQYYP